MLGLVAVGGTAMFVGAAGTSVLGTGAAGSGLEELLALLIAPPLAMLLLFPPLYLLTMRRVVGLRPLRLAALSLSGHAAAGAVLGAFSPVVLLYAMTGDTGWDQLLMCLGLLVAAVVAGTRNVIRNASVSADESPGRLALVGHFYLSTWTAAVLFTHLSLGGGL